MKLNEKDIICSEAMPNSVTFINCECARLEFKTKQKLQRILSLNWS